MINNYSYDINKITPMNDTSVVVQGSNKYNYNEIYGNGFTKTRGSNKKSGHRSQVADIFSITMGLNHHFKFEIPSLMVNNAIKHKQYENFLPIKSLSYKPVSVESTKIQCGIFADFPIFHKRKMGQISVVMNDTSLNDYERALLKWFQPFNDEDTGYVLPLNEIVQTASYTEYNHDGVWTHLYYFDVIPDGDLSTNRQYEQSGLKELSFSLLIVSPIWVYENSGSGPVSSIQANVLENGYRIYESDWEIK